MSAENDPLRLKGDPTASPWLKSVLADAHAEASRPIDVDRLTARVEAAILAAPLGHESPVPAKHPVAAVISSKTAVVGVGIAVGMAVGTVWTMHRGSHPSQPQPAQATLSASPSSRSAAGEVMPVAESAAPTEGVGPSESSPASQAAPPNREARPSGLSEAALLDQARSALASDPRRALKLTQEHARRFPHGALAQEREVIAIEALSRLGQTDAARSRGEQFERSYPGSAHQPKIDQTTRGQ